MKKFNILKIIFFLVIFLFVEIYSVDLTGTYTVGTGGNYANLTEVAAALNSNTVTGNIIFELTANYNGSTGETYPIIFNQFATSGGNWTVTIRLAVGVAWLASYGDPGSGNALIRLNGTDRLYFDGRPGGAGSSAWSIRNSREAASIGPVFELVNDACLNHLSYLNILGNNTNTGVGLVKIGGTSGTTGNDNNVINNCIIRSSQNPAILAATGVYALGTPSKENDNNQIINNEFESLSSRGIDVSTGNGNQWIITGNSFNYTYAAYGYSSSGQTVISFQPGSTSSGNDISDNYIGFSQTWFNEHYFYGISVNAGSGLPTTVDNNEIANVSLDNTGASSNFGGIYVSGGLCEVTNNRIRDITMDGTGTFWGIISDGSSTIDGNEIYNINRKSNNNLTFICILVSGSNDQTVSDNYIHDISKNTTLISMGSQVIGIRATGAALGTQTVTVHNNAIRLGDMLGNEFDPVFGDKTIYTGIDAFSWPGNNIHSYFNTILIEGETQGGWYRSRERRTKQLLLQNKRDSP